MSLCESLETEELWWRPTTAREWRSLTNSRTRWDDETKFMLRVWHLLDIFIFKTWRRRSYGNFMNFECDNTRCLRLSPHDSTWLRLSQPKMSTYMHSRSNNQKRFEGKTWSNCGRISDSSNVTDDCEMWIIYGSTHTWREARDDNNLIVLLFEYF